MTVPVKNVACGEEFTVFLTSMLLRTIFADNLAQGQIWSIGRNDEGQVH